MKINQGIIILGIVLLTFGCKRSDESLSWNSDYTLPLVHGSLGVKDLIPDSLISLDVDSSIILTYEGKLLNLDLDEILKLPDTTILDTFQAPFPSPVNFSPGQVFLNVPEEQALQLSGIELSYAHIKNGLVAYELESSVQGIVTYTYEIPSATDWMGNIFSKSITVPAAPSGGTSSVSGTFKLDDYRLDMTGQNGVSYNKVLTNINCKISTSNNADVSVSSTDIIQVSNSFQELTIAQAEGYFGQHQISTGLEYVSFDGFNKWISGTLDIGDLEVDLIIKNGVGVDLFLQLNELIAEGSDKTVSLIHNTLGQLISLARPTRYNDSIVPTVHAIHLSESNSNVNEFLEALPKAIGYDLEAEINPLGNVSGYHDFYDVNAPVGVFISASMPLSLLAEDLTLEDTLAVGLEGVSGLNQLTLYVEVENGFPLDADIEIGVLDLNDKIISRVFSPTLIESGVLGADGKVSKSSVSNHKIVLNSKDIERIKASGKVVLTVKFNTPGNQRTVLYDSYLLDYNVKADANITIADLNGN